jgi:hypothetical protein
MDGVFLFADDGPVVVAWLKQPRDGMPSRIRRWLAEWQSGKKVSVDA